MVPSWTETLIECGIPVVGRTRYCIHPQAKVQNIPVIGGTKEAQWDLIRDLKPDLILFDKEENPLEMAEECPFKYIATHVTSIEALQIELSRLADLFENPELAQLALDAYDIAQAPSLKWEQLKNPPGLLKTVGHPQMQQQVQYIIWKKPWMSVGQGTYIASVLQKLGAQVLEAQEKYPVLEEADLKVGTLLFSSEPFPFAKKTADLEKEKLAGYVVDGELYSWFGVRSLRLLKPYFSK